MWFPLLKQIHVPYKAHVSALIKGTKDSLKNKTKECNIG